MERPGTMKRHVISRKGAVLAVVVFIAVVLGVLRLTGGPPVYSVAQVRYGLLSDPHSWIGRTIEVHARDYGYIGTDHSRAVTLLLGPGAMEKANGKLIGLGSAAQIDGLVVYSGQWEQPQFPRNLIWVLNSNVGWLSGVDGNRFETYRVTLTAPLKTACQTCAVGHG